MSEAALLFGPQRNLLGILSTPETAAPPPFACLLINVGLMHRIGPRRLNVKLARRLAAQGIPSLRFDLSGIGDSPAARSRETFRGQAVRDMQAAMDEIEAATGIRRFVMLGMCSGAGNGYWLALADPRVVGLLMFDSFSYPTFKTRMLAKSLTLRKSAAARVGGWFGGKAGKSDRGETAAAPTGIFESGTDEDTPSPQDFGRSLQALLDRGTALYLIYAGGRLQHYNYPEQLADALNDPRLMARLGYDYLPDIDHFATSLAAQETLLSAICNWVRRLA